MLAISHGDPSREADHTRKWSYMQQATLDDYGNIITKHVYSNCLWVPRYRNEKNFHCAAFLVLDFDGTRDINELGAQLESEGYAFLLAPTRSHLKAKTDKQGRELPPEHRFRAILPFQEVIWDLAVYRHTARRWAERLDADLACVDGAKAWRTSREVTRLTWGREAEVFTDVPVLSDETQKRMDGEWKAERFRQGIVPRSVRKLLDGNVGSGERNRLLFMAASDLFDCGMDYGQVYDLLQALPWFHEIGGIDTLRSAAKRKQQHYI